jgi:hypothetical protein
MAMNVGWRELRKSLSAVGNAGHQQRVFFRDDDASDDRPALRQLLGLFESRMVPVNLEVIPGLLSAAGTGLLREAVAAHPGLIGLNQHGWRHENHEVAGRKCEFGPSRSFDEQCRDISAGRQRMEEAFGDRFFPVFTPPWNRCTVTTHQVLLRLGFAAISDLGREKSPSMTGLRRLPATLDVIDWKISRDLRPVEELLGQIIQQVGAGSPVGILLHHQAMSQSAFDFITRLIDEMLESGAIEFHLFQSLLKIDHD